MICRSRKVDIRRLINEKTPDNGFWIVYGFEL